MTDHAGRDTAVNWESNCRRLSCGTGRYEPHGETVLATDTLGRRAHSVRKRQANRTGSHCDGIGLKPLLYAAQPTCKRTCAWAEIWSGHNKISDKSSRRNRAGGF